MLICCSRRKVATPSSERQAFQRQINNKVPHNFYYLLLPIHCFICLEILDVYTFKYSLFSHAVRLSDFTTHASQFHSALSFSEKAVLCYSLSKTKLTEKRCVQYIFRHAKFGSTRDTDSKVFLSKVYLCGSGYTKDLFFRVSSNPYSYSFTNTTCIYLRQYSAL
jgi:hypothetical protein